MLPKWWSPPGPESESAPGPESESEAGSGLQCVYLPLRKFIGFGCRRVAGLTLRRCSRLSWARRWALARCLEHHPGSDRPGHTERSASSACLPKEPHAQRSWHLQRSPPVQSEDLPPEVWLPSLSDDERLVEEHARSITLTSTRLLSLQNLAIVVGRLVICITVGIFITEQTLRKTLLLFSACYW